MSDRKQAGEIHETLKELGIRQAHLWSFSGRDMRVS
jgi:hypothetical protein